jgi:hypothetical protein
MADGVQSSFQEAHFLLPHWSLRPPYVVMLTETPVCIARLVFPLADPGSSFWQPPKKGSYVTRVHL